jgi:hypothetical protein
MATSTAHPNHQLISSEDVDGTNVYDVNGGKIGEIDHLMIDKLFGRVTYAVMSFGGFMGIGHSHYPIPWAALKYDTQLNGYVTGITAQQLKDAPAFSDDSWSDRAWETPTYRHLQRASVLVEPSSGAAPIVGLRPAAKLPVSCSDIASAAL